MNPEEGELRPQLLDRFGLTVEVAAPRDPASRAEVVRRRLLFDADPAAFTAGYADADRALRERIAGARQLVGGVRLSEAALLKVAEVCAAFEVEGLRADIVTARAAVAHAAWLGRASVTRADIRAAARLTLPHRRRRNPFDAPGLDEDLLDQVLGDDELPPEPPDGPGSGSGSGDDDGPDSPEDGGGEESPPEAGDAPESAGSGDEAGGPEQQGPEPSPGAGGPERDQDRTDAGGQAPDAGDDAGKAPAAPAAPTPEGTVVTAGQAYRTRLFAVPDIGDGDPGRRSRARTRSGRRVGTEDAPGQGAGSLHLPGTLRAAAPHQASRGRTAGRMVLLPQDLRRGIHEGKESNLVLFCVDASGSMAARKRMAQVKTAILSLLLDAYRRRDKVGLVTFRGGGATLDLPPTGSVEAAARRLDEIPAGGRTPLAEGLLEAGQVLRRERLRDRRRRPLLVVVTDGRATSGPEAVARSRQAAAHLAASGVPALVVDCESGPLRLGLASVLAAHLRAEHVPVGAVSADVLTHAVRERVA
jgi:magnesium chelatase subunit D